MIIYDNTDILVANLMLVGQESNNGVISGNGQQATDNELIYSL